MKRQLCHLIDIRRNFKPQKDWAVFLDRDGVVIKETPKLLYDFKDFFVIPQAAEAIRLLNKENIPVFLTTNQTVVARGLCDEKFVSKTHKKIKKELAKSNAFLDGIFCCLHSPRADVKKYRLDCRWRKPKTGMFEFIAEEFKLNLKKSFLIGDSTRDILAAQKIRIKDILVLTGHAGKDNLYRFKPTLIKKDILEAIRHIIYVSGVRDCRYKRTSKCFKNIKKAVILCGGRGKRLRPLTDKIPKPMTKIGDKPLLEHLINLLREHGIIEIYLAVSYLGEKVEKYFTDGKKWGVKIFYSYDRKPLGGAGAIKLLERNFNSTFIVLNGDVITNLNLTKMAVFHKQKGGIGTISVHKTDHPYDSDIVECDKNFLVKRFFRPRLGDKFKLISKTGTHIFEPKALKFIPKNKKYSLEEEWIPDLLKKGEKLYAYYSKEYSHDMGTPERLRKVRKDCKNEKIKL